MKTTNLVALASVLGSPTKTIIHTFEKVDTINGEVRIRRICSIHVTYYAKVNLCKVEFTGKLHTPSARMMYIPTDQLGMVMTSMTDNYWHRIYTDHVRYEGDGFVCLPMDDMINLIREAEDYINSLLSATNPISPEERVCEYLNKRKN